MVNASSYDRFQGANDDQEDTWDEDRARLGAIFAEITQERDRQDEKWGEQNHAPFTWLAILGEEFGEISRAALEAHFQQGVTSVPLTQNYRHYREELIQLAAVAVAMVECLDRDTWREAPPYQLPQD